MCGGKQSSCSADSALGSPVLMSAESCTTGSVRSGLSKVARSTQSTTAFQSVNKSMGVVGGAQVMAATAMNF